MYYGICAYSTPLLIKPPLQPSLNKPPLFWPKSPLFEAFRGRNKKNFNKPSPKNPQTFINRWQSIGADTVIKNNFFSHQTPLTYNFIYHDLKVKSLGNQWSFFVLFLFDSVSFLIKYGSDFCQVGFASHCLFCIVVEAGNSNPLSLVINPAAMNPCDADQCVSTNCVLWLCCCTLT